LTERFTRAVEQLGNKESLTIRLGGIYALERIAQDSERDHWTVMEVLCSFVRTVAERQAEAERQVKTKEKLPQPYRRWKSRPYQRRTSRQP
jgi:hypothetical protein